MNPVAEGMKRELLGVQQPLWTLSYNLLAPVHANVILGLFYVLITLSPSSFFLFFVSESA